MVQYADASTVMGASEIDSSAIDELARGEYKRGVSENMPRDYVTMYHPDGSTSIVQLPPLAKNGKNLGDRQRKLMHFILNKKRVVRQADGTMKSVQWWYPSPPAGWKPTETPWRCPVQECTRAGGLKDLLNLWRHIKSKHPGECEMYEGVLTAIKKRLQESTAMNLDLLFTGGGNDGDQPLVSEEELEVAKFQDASDVLEMPTSNIPAGTFYNCADCEWTPKPDAVSPSMALKMHRKHKHKEE